MNSDAEKVRLVEDFIKTDIGVKAQECGHIVICNNDNNYWVEINKVVSEPMASDNQSIALKRLLLTLI
ncbi:MAG: hypothetical protein PHT07_10230 [Paludibacter sp.]|nr:hypothetical protein [Paludibacter sp.]